MVAVFYFYFISKPFSVKYAYMKLIYTLLTSALSLITLLLLIGFAIKNVAPVELHYYLGFVWRAPLSLVVLISLLIGVVTGAMVCLKPYTSQRKRLIALERELQSLNSTLPKS